MKLGEWLEQEGLSVSRFATRIGEHSEVVRRYTLPREHPDSRIPRHGPMCRIYLATGGEVTPNDYYDLPDLPDAPALEARG